MVNQSLREMVRLDAASYGFARPLFILLMLDVALHAGLLASTLYRLAHWFRNHESRFTTSVATIIQRFNLFLTGCDINFDAIIGPGIQLPHPQGVVIGKAVIGLNVVIFQNVTIGLRHEQRRSPDIAEYPTVGDHCTLGAGAVILGALVIGSHAAVGANAVVLRSVPPGKTAVGVPARILDW